MAGLPPLAIPPRPVYNIFGTGVVPIESEIAVGTTLTELANHNPNRVFLLLVNNGSVTVYLQFSGQLASGHGIALTPTGGYIFFLAQQHGEILALPVYATAASGSATVYKLETVMER